MRTNHHPTLPELERAVCAFCAGIYGNPLSGWLLVIAGANGCGKTHCADRVLEWLRHVGPSKQVIPQPDFVRSISFRLWRWPMLLDALKNGEWGLVEDLRELDVLILDDLGAGHDPSRIGTEKLCQLLSGRERRWTLLTTNVPEEQWEEAFERRVASRFYRNSRIVDMRDVPDFCGVNHE